MPQRERPQPKYRIRMELYDEYHGVRVAREDQPYMQSRVEGEVQLGRLIRAFDAERPNFEATYYPKPEPEPQPTVRRWRPEGNATTSEGTADVLTAEAVDRMMTDVIGQLPDLEVHDGTTVAEEDEF